MSKIITVLLFTVSLSGCATVQSWIPSFWDDNQSRSIIDVRQAVSEISCEPGTQLKDADRVLSRLEWFRLYSESKGTRQQDVLKIIAPMEETVRDWRKRSAGSEGSTAYCTVKKRTLALQANRAAAAILGRF